MRFFLDANMPYSTLELFKELDLEAQHAKDVGLGKAQDKEIMNYAIKNKCILITKDLEFGNVNMFPTENQHGLIILRLPFYFTASQITNSLKDFFISIKLEDLEKSITIVKLGRYRIRKF